MAEDLYFLEPGKTKKVTVTGGKQKDVQGLGNAKRPIHYPNLGLDTGPFG